MCPVVKKEAWFKCKFFPATAHAMKVGDPRIVTSQPVGDLTVLPPVDGSKAVDSYGCAVPDTISSLRDWMNGSECSRESCL